MSKAQPSTKLGIFQKKREKLPQMLVKDRNYLNDMTKNGFSWNNKHRTKGKYYSFFHDINDRLSPSIEKIEMEDLENKKLQAKARIQRLAENRCDSLKSFHDKALVRTLIQVKSNQDLRTNQQLLNAGNLEEMMILYEKLIAKKAIRAKHVIHNDNKWNFYLEQDQKRSELLITPITLKAEEAMVAYVQKKIQKELETETLNESVKYENLRNFQKKLLRNRSLVLGLDNDPKKKNQERGEEKLKDINLISEIKSTQVVRTDFSGNSVAYNLFSPTPGSFISNNERISSSSPVPFDTLTSPKKRKFLPKKDLERTEFNGLLIKNCNEGLSETFVPFISALTAKSQLCSQINTAEKSSQNSRLNISNLSQSLNARSVNDNPKHLNLQLNEEYNIPLSRGEIKPHVQSKPSKSHQLLRNLIKTNSPTPVVDELNQFELRLNKPKKYGGFPRTNLELTMN